MKIRSISSCALDCGGINFRQRRRFLSVPISALALGATLNVTFQAHAQGGAVLPPLVPAPPVAAPLPAASPINVLIVALDDLTVNNPDPVFIPAPAVVNPAPAAVVPAPAPLQTAPATAAPNTARAPITIAPLVPAPAPLEPISPAAPRRAPIVPANPTSFETSVLKPRWLVNAQQVDNTEKPKTKKELERERQAARDAELFRLAPDTGGTVARPGVPALPTIPDSRVQLSPLSQQNPPGRAQLTAISLRRLLMARGYNDVLTVAPDSTAIERTLGERRLTPRVIDNLKRSMNTLSRPVTPEPSVVTTATRSAVRVGQSLGYRAVIVLYMTPASQLENGLGAGFTMILADTNKETGEPISVDETGADETTLRENGATSAVALLDKSLRDWAVTSNADRINLATRHLDNARTAWEAGNFNVAQDEVNQSISLDPSRGEAFVLQGDILNSADPAGAAIAYRRAVELNTKDGRTWAKVAQAYAYSPTPDWPRALDAANKALNVGYDSAPLRIAMATAQYGRGTLFRKAERLDKAEDAEFEARTHLDRALELSPNDPSAIRLLAKALVSARRFDEALRTLDRIAPRYPSDLEIQTQYATALGGQKGREEDAFVAYGRVWKLAGLAQVDIDATTYKALAEGFDVRVANLGKTAAQLTTGVANGAFPRESAFLQLTKLKEDAATAESTINTIRPLGGVNPGAAAARVFAADLINQSLDAHQTYLETGQELYRGRGLELYRQAIARLNDARLAG